MLSRRNFHGGLVSAAFGGLALSGCSALERLPEFAARTPGYRTGPMKSARGYGEPVHRPEKPLLDLPPGFDYRIVSAKGEPLDGGGGEVPDHADGMGSFDMGGGLVALVRNHETDKDGGTTTIVFDCKSGKRVSHHRSLTGTSRNCAGGVTPWGTWLSCEEQVTLGPDHGWVHQVPAIPGAAPSSHRLDRLGRFNHEAAVVDPDTGIVYMTEDRIDGLFYRFVPEQKGPITPASKGVLQALAFADPGLRADSRNWERVDWTVGESPRPVVWVTLDNVAEASRRDSLRLQGHARRAVRFACGEGVHFGDGELYFTVTSGGVIKSGQIFRYRPGEETLELFLESTDPRAFNYGDNLVVAPNGDLIVCEDAYVGGEGNYWARMISGVVGAAPGCGLRGVTPDGGVYKLAWVPGETELAGPCFSPDGQILFVNIYSPAATLAISGPKGWQSVRPGWNLPKAGRLPGAILAIAGIEYGP
jgi:secreted PhoX family phosphatase